MTSTTSKHRFTSFVVVLSMVLSMFTAFNITAEAATEKDMDKVCKTLEAAVTVNGQEIDPSTEYDRNAILDLTLNYELKNNEAKDSVLVYTLPEGIKADSATGYTFSLDGVRFGTYEIRDK